MRLDNLDLEIVRVLSGDGRATYSEISKILGVSVGTVRNRITQMRKTRMLHLNVWLDPYRSGLGVNATLLLKVHAGRIESVTSSLVDLDETGYVATLTGGHDVLVDVFCLDVPHLSQFIHNQIQTIDGVMSVTSYLVTDIKYDSSLNIRRVINKAGYSSNDGGRKSPGGVELQVTESN